MGGGRLGVLRGAALSTLLSPNHRCWLPNRQGCPRVLMFFFLLLV